MTVITKIVSGGQSGADQGGLDAAIELGIPHGGWCPKGRKSEDGAIPDKYNLVETKSGDYRVRTEQNVVDSDATVVFTYGPASGGSALTVRIAGKHQRPCLNIDLCESRDDQVIAQEIVNWLSRASLANPVLNVAGSRGSGAPGIQERVKAVMNLVLYKPEPGDDG